MTNPTASPSPTPEDEPVTYEARKALYQRRYQLWSVTGKVGPPPPYPIRPHTPGYRTGEGQ